MRMERKKKKIPRARPGPGPWPKGPPLAASPLCSLPPHATPSPLSLSLSLFTFRHVREEVRDAPPLLDVGDRVGFQGVDHVRKLHAVPHEEDGHVVAHQVPVPLPGVEFDGKAAGVPDGFRGAALVDDCGEAGDDRRLHPRRPEQVGAGEVGDVVGDLEEALGGRAPGVDDPLGDALPVKLRGVGGVGRGVREEKKKKRVRWG